MAAGAALLALAAGTVAQAAPLSRPARQDTRGREHIARSAPRTIPRKALTGSRMRVRRQGRQLARDVPPPLVFGIYPGGAAGTVGPAGVTKPELADRRLDALDQLRGASSAFVLHLYDSYTGPADGAAVPGWLQKQIDDYTAHGYKVELVLAYRPADPAGDVEGFAGFVRSRVRQLGANSAVTQLQVTNEANVGGAPQAADGAYRGARDALVRGVIAAKDEARHGGFDQLRIGFNWAYQLGRSESAFFSYLGSSGGAAFADAVDWVGLDAYPGTWGPALGRGDLASGVRTATIGAMRTLREKLLPLARLSSAPMHFAESGYPTGPDRTEAMQQAVVRAAVETIDANRGTYGVTDYRWFDLRDADSAGNFESQYGITRDDYSPKAAFFTYRDLISKLG